MNHADHVNLLRGGVQPGGVWADLGAGTGAFTLALAELLGAQGEIYAVDRDGGALRSLAQAMRARFPDVSLHFITADFTRPLDLPPLDGVVMANSLHFIPHPRKPEVLRLVQSLLKPGGRLLVVEYDTDTGNIWVPHPFTYPQWESLARQCGFAHTRLLATHPSSFLRQFYAAGSEKRE
jgi:ubiquinone/menaquinone biosynthesis C-methylase UbiE